MIYSDMIKLAVFDIDGTLTRDGSVKPSDYTIDVLNKINEKGIKLGIASGRDVLQLKQIVNEWDLPFSFSLLIGLNGSEYYDLDKNDIKHLYELSSEDVKDICDKLLGKFPDLNASIYREGKRYLLYEDEMALSSKKRNKMGNVIVPLEVLWEKPCGKLMFRVDEETMKKIEPLANQISNDRYRACKTQTTMMEFVHAKSNKGNALKMFCEHNNIDLNDVIAVGDMNNDNELLLTAGIGVCMKNGAEETKKCADYITDLTNNQDGCAHFLLDYFSDLF